MDDVKMDDNASEAMTLLIKLDKGIRSKAINTQCDSVIRFSELVLQHPLPIIVSSSLMKLSELFRNW